MRLGILASHPIQYQAPWFRHLATRLDLEVFFAHRQDAQGQANAGFGVKFDWDVDLLSGYKHRFLKNVAKNPGLDTFAGCDTPELYDIIQSPPPTAHRRTDIPTHRFSAFLILGWNRKSFIQGIRACRRAGVPVMMRGDSQLRTPRARWKTALKYLPYRWMLPQLNAHLYVGQRNKEYLKHYGVAENRLFFCPHFVDNEWFRGKAEIARKQRAEIRMQWRIPEDAFVALFVGKFIAMKRPQDFIHACLRASETHPDFHALLVGDGPLRPELERLARARTDRFHFAGFRNQSEMPSVYAAADLLVLTSESETWGLVVNEAMACGLPAIVSDSVGCGPDLIDEGQTGSTYPLGDVAGLTDKLIELKSKLAQVGERVRMTVLKKAAEYAIDQATCGLFCACEEISSSRKKHDEPSGIL